MAVQTDLGNIEALKSLLNEARAEADALRLRMEKYEKTLMSSRLLMGHELKRPATAISGYLELALEEIDAKDTVAVREVLAKARSECESLGELTAFFLELLRLDVDAASVEGRTLAARECVEDIVTQFPPELNAAKRVAIDVAPDAETLRFNPDALKVVLSNVIENGLVYSDADAPVNVVIEKTADKRGIGDGDLVMIKVTDKGVGIPDDCLKRIFKPFVRLNRRSARGSGLGLTLVRSLVDLHGGSVYVRSVEGHGTTVCIAVPETPVRNGRGYVS